MPELPDNIVDLGRVGLADLRRVEAMPKTYRVYMFSWHEPKRKQHLCEVCYAGAVMPMSLNADPTKTLLPYEFGARIGLKLRALNYLRRGHPWDAWSLLNGGSYPYKTDFYYIPAYDARDPEPFHAAMNAMLDQLETEHQT